MLSIRYAAEVPPAMAQMLEHHARSAGLSLAALEIIGASLDFVEAFIVASEDGEAQRFLESHGLVAPADPVGRARWTAQKLFG